MARGSVGGAYRGKHGNIRGNFRSGGGGGSNSNFRGGGSGRGGRGGFRPRGSGGPGQPGRGDASNSVLVTDDGGTAQDETFENAKIRDEIDERLGFKRWEHGTPRVGWLVNMHATLLRDDDDTPGGKAAVDYYFIQEDGASFKSTVVYEPYFLIACKQGTEGQVEEWLLKKYEEQIVRLERRRKDDLNLPNHLLGYRKTLIQIFFRNQNDLFQVRRELLPIALKNASAMDAVDTYAEVINNNNNDYNGNPDIAMSFGAGDGDNDNDNEAGFVAKSSRVAGGASPSEFIIDIREYDVPYYLRVAIDKEIRVGLWYTVSSENGEINLKCITERVERAEPVVMAFDIEVTKAPLKFPDAANDQIMMISYMVDGQGFLITNREIVSEDIEDFEYTPKDEYEGPFTVFNEINEKALIERFFEHIREVRPTIISTYNGDSFDFPFVETRATLHGIDMLQEIGFAKDREGEYKSRHCVHMDCFRWVKRDSYLPQGSQGLKAVTVAKLGYNPLELDPELMTPYAQEKPHVLSQYSVSDAVATYYLYMKYVHPFVFSLCNIIPLNPDEVLRKGSGTLCETLLMVQAYRGEIIMPNRHIEGQSSFYEGHLLESETYVGGHVEALEAGVFRSDIPVDFKIVPSACDKLIADLDHALKFSLVEEGNVSLDDVENYDEVKAEIQKMLEQLRDHPIRHDTPLIYHLDVAAMYPNIMLSNRLQPDSVKTEADCAACDYNRPGKQCDRRMTWAWRGEYFPAKLDEFKMVRNALESETFPPARPGWNPRKFKDLKPSEQTTLVHKRLGDYSRKVYKKTHETKIVKKETIICQRENSFYIDTVRDFRDRRYTYKGLHKTWKKNLDKASGSVMETMEAKKMIILYDSLQLAHKCILNSFYGYVMRKGARWHSMEMAGITCLTGASIIQMARKLVEQLGRPLELDTDGIWCMLPSTFPDNFTFKLKEGKKFGINYPCTMLNHLVHADFTNDQYHELVDRDRGQYKVKSENSIFFELDGPYRAMILPSSKEEDKLLKKRYAVFNDDGSLAELKGFEVKRRGELQLIKIFQSQIFEQFLLGTTLEECYGEVAKVADQWLDILSTKGASLSDAELVDLIAENRSMSKTLAEYAGQKSTSISTAKRLAEFLGEGMVKDKGLACRFIVSAKPTGAPVTERAVPVAIFSAEPTIKRHFLRKWLHDNSVTDFDLRSILDWDYYIERLGSVVQKLITIPAAMQKVSNPVPRIQHPDWLLRRVNTLQDRFKQHNIQDMFAQMNTAAATVQLSLPAVETQSAPAASKESDRQQIQVPVVAPPPPPKRVAPDITKNYSKWLHFSKKTWRQQRAARKSAASTGVSKAAGRIGAMFGKQTFNLSSHVWEIVQISELPNGRPGEYRMWLLIRDTLQSVKLCIPRRFYLNFKKLDDVERTFPTFCQYELVTRTLPRGHPCYNLVSCTTEETLFVKNAAAVSMLMNHPDVDGTYETQVPHLVRALLKLGNKCNPAPKRGATLSKGLDTGFSLDDLAQPTTTLSRRSYLDGGRNLQYIYLYHSNQDSRHVLCLVVPGGEAKLYVVDKGRNRELPNMDKYYVEAKSAIDARRRLDNGGKLAPLLFDYPELLRVDSTYHADPLTAYRAISKELSGLQARKLGPSILAICSAQVRSFYETAIPNAQLYPIIMIPSSKVDNTYPTRLLWQGPAAKRMMQHYLRLAIWLKERLDTAHRTDIPIANLEADSPAFVTDIEYARRLQKADVLLWWSPKARPDLGGRQDDANAVQLSDDAATPEIVKAGAYTNACVEVTVKDLAIDAILQSALVYELEGAEGGASLGFTEASHNLDEYAKGTAHEAVILGDAVLPTQIFSIVKAMVKTWWTDGQRSDGAQARKLLDHFWRWCTSSSSALYDPALQKFVLGLMRKTFSQLLAEFRRLGSDVVYANFNKIVLSTSKPSPSAAYAYSNYLISSLGARDLFKFLHLEIVHFWSLYVQMDASNLAGIICEDPLVEEELDYVKAKRPKIQMTWLIQALLPPALRPHFAHVVALFISGLRDNKLKHGEFRTPLRALPTATQTQPDLIKKDEIQQAKSFVATTLTRTMLKVVEQVRREYQESLTSHDEEVRASFIFPRLPGSQLSTQKVVLEFVKSVCAVLALARELSVEVGVLRKNVLDLIGVREFAAEAALKPPSTSFKIATVCPHCQSARDLDLCKDPELLLGGAGSEDSVWPCPSCKHSLDKIVVEGKLIEMVQKHTASFSMQDLRCQRCNQVKAANMNMICECSGGYKLETSSVDFWKKIRTIRDLAEHYSFAMVAELADECLAYAR